MKSQVIDSVDWQLLGALQDDASQSNQSLAERFGLSTATCLRRVRRLREGGWIVREAAVLDPDRLGALLTAVIEVSLDRQDAAALEAFELRVVADEAVQQCYRVSPGPDFVLIATVRDMPGYQALAQRLFTADANVRNVKAFFSVKRAKFDPRVPLPTTSSGPSAAASSSQS
ncbi:Leucine-responsive regulatory protein [Variovorax sp. PBS-H4]|uniref:Lrp/AsnC family transcriptional regulator n=1 Tax=Variovorax sp. PBS-H4 TaxID=434008 RepID=UPI001319931F|nr:Lrp/AsnC family transcriptional regulator [Variovorax sp. PBS-H4]VTU22718.1 Leucine-responsive regulatory protein [Variovorax sp. PBS-H4]